MWLEGGPKRSLHSPLCKTEKASIVPIEEWGREASRSFSQSFCCVIREGPKAPRLLQWTGELGPVSQLLVGNLAPFPTCLLCPFSRAPQVLLQPSFLQRRPQPGHSSFSSAVLRLQGPDSPCFSSADSGDSSNMGG